MRGAADAAQARAQENSGALARVWDDLTTMIRLVRAYADRSYREVPWNAILKILGALLYFLSPLDAVPDFIPGVGYLDDVAVLVWVASALSSELATFRAWERRRRKG